MVAQWLAWLPLDLVVAGSILDPVLFLRPLELLCVTGTLTKELNGGRSLF